MSTALYIHLTYEDYKNLEKQMRERAETIHTATPGPFYHKSIRLQINRDTYIEFHGPNVKGIEDEIEVRPDRKGYNKLRGE